MNCGSSCSGNSESGRINLVLSSARSCAITEGLRRANQAYCPPSKIPNSDTLSGNAYIVGKSAGCYNDPVNSNIILNSQFVPQSTYIAHLQSCAIDNVRRFSEYTRLPPPPPCPALPALANSATVPKPSLNTCLPNKNATLI